MNCLKCGKETTNPKFCSKSCAASYNNKRRNYTLETKRKISKSLGGKGIAREDRICKVCGKVGIVGEQYCSNCLVRPKPNPEQTRNLSFLNIGYEKELSLILSKEFGSLHKERISGSFFDFCNDNVMIEFTFDSSHGTKDLIERFHKVVNDTRRKIAYIPNHGISDIRKKKITDLGVEIRYSSIYRYLL